MTPLFLNPHNWINNIPFTKGRLLGKSEDLIPKNITTAEDYKPYALKSWYSYNETYSDKCLMWAMTPSSTNWSRYLPSECLDMIQDETIDPTYNVSHRLLFLQVAKASNCKLEGENCKLESEIVEAKIEKFCDFMLWEADIMQPLLLTNYGFDDLFLEESKYFLYI